MRIAYLILAHDHPAHLARIVAALASDTTLFYVHVDAKADERRFAASRKPGVTFCARRVKCAWGNISLVDATLELAKVALAGPRCDYYVLLSGACYPVQPREYIAQFFAQHDGTEFLQAFAFPDPRFGKPIERLTRYYLKRDPPFVGTKWRVQKWLQRLLPPRNYRAALGDMELVTGSQWWALTDAALRYVVDRVASQGDVYRFCRHVDCPDELVFQLILWNSPFRSSISHSLTFTDWPSGSSSPAVIDERTLARFAASPVIDSERNNCPDEKREVLFARKFNDAAAATVATLDRLIEIRREPSAEAVERTRPTSAATA